MRLGIRKTWSQQELAVQLRLEPETSHALLTWERRRLIIHAAKTALAASICWWLASLIGLKDGYWGSISAIIVLQSNFGSTVTASRDRLLGTLIGAIFGFSFSLVGTLPWNYFAAVLAAVSLCGIIGFRSSSRLAGVTISITMLIQGDSHWTVALTRVCQVVLGVLVAMTVSTLVFPDRARLRLRDGLAQEFLVMGTLFDAILEGFRGKPSASLAKTREDAAAILRGNGLLLDAARHEPSGGPGWREGLGALSQFGRAIYDALIALEIAVRDTHSDQYAQRLEPALGRLAVDIHGSFHWVARCVHEWKFQEPPPGINLEEDIGQLEARMAEVRHTGAEFGQAEILRAYAVQLHLKQLARLLRASRVETGHAVGDAQE